MGRVRPPNGSALPSPYVELDRAAWARLRDQHPLSLTEDDVTRLQGTGDRLDLAEVEQVYLPLSRLLNFYVAATAGLHRITTDFLGERPERTPPVPWRWASPPPRESCVSCWPGGPARLGSSS
jgi:type I pantothenate kinase